MKLKSSSEENPPAEIPAVLGQAEVGNSTKSKEEKGMC